MTSDRIQALPLMAIQESCGCCSTPTEPLGGFTGAGDASSVADMKEDR